MDRKGSHKWWQFLRQARPQVKRSMAQTIRIKRRAAAGGAGAPTTLASAELAFNESEKILYYGLGNDGGEAQSVIAIGGEGAFVPGTGSYVGTVVAEPDTGVSATTAGQRVTIAGIDATTAIKGVVKIATQQDINDGTPGVVPDASLINANTYVLPEASALELGGIKVGNGLAIEAGGKLNVTLEQGTVYKGEADFTDADAEPDDPENGWIYTNTSAGTAAWTGIIGEDVAEGVQAIWSEDGNTWSLIASAGGVTAVTGTLPIEIDIATNGASQPIVKVQDATAAATGVVRLADATAITNGTAGRVVTADQLKGHEIELTNLPDGTAAGDVIQWTGAAWEISNEIDGGQF